MEVLNKILKFVIVMLFLLLVLIVILQVFSRYIPAVTIPWTEEVARFFLIFVTFIGSAIAIRDNEHITITFLINKLPFSFRKYMNILIYILIILFLLVFLKGSFEMIKMTWFVPSISLPRIKIGYIYLVLPIGTVLMIFFILSKLFTSIKSWINNS